MAVVDDIVVVVVVKITVEEIVGEIGNWARAD
jgi:hypothetical protein